MLIIIQGLISSGKDYLCKALQENGISKLVGYTTRPMRVKEVNGVEYYFIDKQTYHAMNKMQPFVATRTATVISKDKNGEDSREIQFYGIHTNSVDLSKHQTIILDENGTNQMTEAIGRDNCLVLRLVCDEDILKERAERQHILLNKYLKNSSKVKVIEGDYKTTLNKILAELGGIK